MPPHSKNTRNTPNNSGNGRNQQDGNRDFRHDQGQPLEMIQMMQTLVGVVQQQVTTRDNLARMMEQRRGHHGRTIEFKRLSPPTFEGTTEPMEAKKLIIEMENSEFLNALKVRKWLMQLICCVEMLMTGGGWKKTSVAKRLSLGLGSYLNLYSMRNIFLRVSVFKRKRVYQVDTR